MKFSEQWLREWVDPAVTTQQLADQLTMAGLEVDAIEPAAPAFDHVVVGEVLAVEPHPQADRLQVCSVNIAATEALQIVCGAKNVRAGMRVPTACVGATLPGGLKIKKARLRGVASSGMLCSAKELGLAEAADGLMALPADAPVGSDVRDYLGLDDACIELGLTPNRSDCLSIAGIARETGVLNRCDVHGPEIEAVAATRDETFAVSVDAPLACPRYLGRVIRGIDRGVSTPLWMQERLRRCGVRSIDAVVDVTNYVLLELGQPMHAFDLARLRGGIRVRHAQAGETLTLLDGAQITLSEGTLVIADDQGPQALAGVMGGQHSAVSADSEALFLESAFFAPAAIAGKARSYGLHTDSSHRFERGVDPELPRRALERATRLLLDIVGGEAGPVTEVVDRVQLPQPRPITLRAARLARVLGMEFVADEVGDILQRLGLAVTRSDEQGWQAVAPSFRFDLAIEADLVEEVARIHGYDALPSSHPGATLRLEAGRNRDQATLQRVRRALVERGYQEAITYSFVDRGLQQRLDPEHGAAALALANPLSAELAVMRTSLWPGLVQALQYNLNRQQNRLRFFESGVKFLRQGDDIREEKVVAGVVTGPRVPEQWGTQADDSDFFDVKGDVEALLALTGAAAQYRFAAATHPVLHPGQCARISAADETVGWLGSLHPEVAAQLDLADRNVLLFELSLAALQTQGVAQFSELSRFPAIRRDLAVIVGEAVSAEQLSATVREAGGELLREVQIFDVYRGKGIERGAKSLAIGLTLQDFSRTLTDEEVETVVAGVLQALADKLGATLRE